MIAAAKRREPAGAELGGQRQEALQLIAYLHECQTAGIARRACIVHLARLAVENWRPHHLRLARAALEPLTLADRARIFMLPNRNIVALWRGSAETAVAASRAAIAHLFSDGDDGVSPDLLWEDVGVPDGADRLLLVAKDSIGVKAPAPAVAGEGKTFDAATLHALEAQLARADVARFARRHAVYARAGHGGFRPAWERRCLCIDELAATLAPEHAPQADPWLFLRLTRTLDRRMLALLGAPGELAGAGAFAIHLNVSSILSPSFLRFDAVLPAALRGQVTIDLQPADVLAEPSAFQFARDFARARGYRLMLDRVTPQMLPVFPLDRIGLDLVHLQWSEACQLPDIATLLPDPSKIVLGQADNADAIAWGTRLGISLFQGRAAVNAEGGA
jgi:hypothetical protein